MELFWYISLFITTVFAIDQHNQIILAPTTSLTEDVDVHTPIDIKPTDVYVSGDLLCNDEGCYPLLFEPSSDWKVIKPEQRLPAGLDIRVNLETGLKEAKLGDANPIDDATTTAVTNVHKQVDAPSENYEFSEQFAKLRDSLAKQDYSTVESQFDDLMDFAHDYKHGYKIIIKEFDFLQGVALNNSLPLNIRELDARMIIACIRNNPPVIEYIEQNYPNFVRDIFNNINEVQDVTPDVQLLVKRFINILTVLIESDPTYIVGVVDFETLRKVFYTIDDKQLKLRILEIIASFVDRVHHEELSKTMKRDGIMFVIPKIQDWTKEFSKFVRDSDIDEVHLRKFFNTLYDLKTDFGTDIKIDTSFINWLINQIEIRSKSLNNGIEQRDVEQDTFDRKLIDSRHKVFGNEMADSIKNFHDEL
ncbi:nucleotide exchange factor sil1 [Maudiozyma exigua]|uniref:Nucleotide exchange factor SIL1 n=1 Tax=Maudiozyma exigua TaxID=34358 RepID=A0A9P7BBQ8_MAUEX|nr:nucleotide exchange factor sil1 [Kazachstania exigua]